MYLGLFERDRLIAMGYVSYLDGYVIIKDIFVDERLLERCFHPKVLKYCTATTIGLKILQENKKTKIT